ncbi:hypothetical protein T06_4680 [Trichinella sp. T6]|nr:hypothetical protein T06_4680 [Trichinella sp. T6]
MDPQTSSRAVHFPPIWSSPWGGLAGRLVHCWPTCAAGILRRRARMTTGPPSSWRLPRSRMKSPSRPCTCDSTLLQPLGERTQDSVWRASERSPLPGRTETDRGEAVFAYPLFVISPEESAGVSIVGPHSDLQVHLLDVGLQPYAKATEGDDRTQEVNLEIRPHFQLAV